MNTQPKKYSKILLAVDVHSKSYVVCRQFDHSAPQNPERMPAEAFIGYARKQLENAEEVHVVYEAGCFGYVLARKLIELGIKCYVVRPKKLDPYNKRVQTDKTDALELVQDLDRYVRGNTRAMCVITIPTVEEELRRAEGRHRKAVQKDILAIASRGRSFLLMLGFKVSNQWWKPRIWNKLQDRLSDQARAILEANRKAIEALEPLLKEAEKRIVSKVNTPLPVGFGKLTFCLLRGEVLRWERFKTRRQVGGFTGLCGGVSSSGPYHADLNITKCGHRTMRTLLIELAWRMVMFQSEYLGVKKWESILRNPKASRASRKKAVVALARQLAVDLWKWQTGKVDPETLGWKMAAA